MQRRFSINPIILFAVFITSLHSETVQVAMRHLTVEDGLSKSAGVSLLQDDQGFMWIGTYDGLNRYDGYQFRVFRPVPDDTSSLSNNYINSMIEDRDHRNLWIGTRDGLNRYSMETETFKEIQLSGEFSGLDITALCQDNRNRIWAGTEMGLCLLDSAFQPSWLYRQFSEFRSEAITLLFCDQDGNIWMGTETGFYRIQPENLQPVPIQFEGRPNGLRVWSMARDKRGVLWVGSDGGLWRVDEASRTCVQPSDAMFRKSVVREIAIKGLFADDSGALWIGTWGEGVYRYSPDESRLDHIVDIQSSPLPQHVFRIIQDFTGLIWIGSKTGVHLYDPYQKPFIAYPIRQKNEEPDWTVTKIIVQDPNRQNILWVSTDRGLMRTDIQTGESEWIPVQTYNPFQVIHMLYMESSGLLWLGTNGELLAYDTKKDRWRHFPELRHPDPHVTTMSYYAILRDYEGMLWLGTYEHGLIRFDPDNHIITHFEHRPQEPNTLPDDHIWALIEDHEHRLWIGTDKGFALFRRGTETFATYCVSDTFPLISNQIRVFQEDHQGALWIGMDGGICRFAADAGEITCYSEKDGLPNHVIHGILEESGSEGEKRAIWASTNHGLLRFSPASNTWTSFYKEDGLHSSEFSRNCFCQLQDGRLIFGGIRGWTLFDPSQFMTNPHAPKVALTNFELFHEPVPIGRSIFDHVFLDRAVSYTPKIELSHQQIIFGFQFVALHFAHPEKNRIQYYLEGFDPNWIDSRGTRNATYTNLAPGKYTFHVKAANPDGVWSEKTSSIDIVIRPQFGQRWSVRILSVLILILSGVAYYRIRTHQIRKRNALLERLNTELEQQIQERKKVEKSLRESKKLLTHSLEEKEVLLKEIHHRVKNNLQVVKSLLSLQSSHLIHEKDRAIFKESQDRVQAIALIHQKLYKSENLAHIDFEDYIKSLVTDLYSIYKMDSHPIAIHFDVRDVYLSINCAVPCGLIINELVSNAMKYAFADTQVKNSRIDISLSQDASGNILLVVKDNGGGLPEGFDLNQVDTLGLELVRLLVEKQLHGKLTVTKKGGARFKITFHVE